ncbi:hypothetical protein JCM8208_002055 [Rhodotorula glutinis]
MAATTQQQRPPTSLLDHTLRTAPLNIVYGTAASTTLGAAAGAATGVVRDQPAIPAAFRTAIRTGVFSFTFFSIREYAVIPLLTHLSLHPSPLPPSPTSSSSSTPPAPPPNPHTANLVPTTLSALIAGTAFSAYQRPAPALLHARAGLTLAIGCAVLQGIVNEADLIRIKMLLRGEEKARVRRFEDEVAGAGEGAAAPLALGGAPSRAGGAPTAAGATPTTPSVHTDLTHQVATTPSLLASDPGRETFSERSDRLISSAWAWTRAKASSLSPVTKLDEDEYARRLRERMDGVERERERVRGEREELERVGERLKERQRAREKDEGR